jgi:hypothetical protein
MGLDRNHLVQVHDARSMHPQKLLWVEPGLELVQAQEEQEALAQGVDLL